MKKFTNTNTVYEIKNFCRCNKIIGYSKKNKSELIQFVNEELTKNDNKLVSVVEKKTYLETTEIVKKHYGEIARSNGLEYEEKLTKYLNENIEEKYKIINLIKSKYSDLEDNGKFICFGKDKVESIYTKQTTRKADLYYKTKKYSIGISVKMSNKGTQLQIVSYDNFKIYLESNGIRITPKQEEIFKKFLGIIKPSKEEIIILNKTRKSNNKNKKRYWMNELQDDDKKRTIDFLNTHYNQIIKFILSDGMCKHSIDKAEFFILNDSYYTKTKKIIPKMYTYEQLYKLLIGSPKITKDGNLELSSTIGLQRKGSGNNSSAECLQFKDRGLKKILNNKIEI